MRAFIFALLLNVASGRFVGGGDLGGGIVSRDGPTEDVVDKDFVINEIKRLIESAISGTTADDLTLRSEKIKNGALAELNAGGEKISDEQSDAILRKMASKYPSVSTADLLNADVLVDEAYRVSAALKMLKECSEAIKTLQGKAEPYSAYLKAIIKLADIIISSSRRVVDRYMLELYNRDVNRRNILRRQGKKGPWTAGGQILYDKANGLTAQGSLDYTHKNLKVGAQVNYNQYSGPSFGLGASFSFG
ncbi:unnamed protein product [Lymnaea stagnalis]|uniref:Uncharacterized protein n=1 Tax=Lymnaea stagnalis TaxID=6523 RepID=A0AAV2HTI8_LYMST